MYEGVIGNPSQGRNGPKCPVDLFQGGQDAWVTDGPGFKKGRRHSEADRNNSGPAEGLAESSCEGSGAVVPGPDRFWSDGGGNRFFREAPEGCCGPGPTKKVEAFPHAGPGHDDDDDSAAGSSQAFEVAGQVLEDL